MSRAADCGSCLSGDHSGHVRDWNITPGLIGGEYCACTGDCAERAKAMFDKWRALIGPPASHSTDQHAAVGPFIDMLVRRGVVTTDPGEARECCGLPRDEDGFCSHRPGHPIYLHPAADPGESGLRREAVK